MRLTDDVSVELLDDGTLDTVIEVTVEPTKPLARYLGETIAFDMRYSHEFAAEFRNSDGSLRFREFIEAIEDDIYENVIDKAYS